MQILAQAYQHILDNGVVKTDRTGTGTISVFGMNMRFDLAKGFPIVTTKKVFFKAVVLELLWFLRGDSNINWLKERGCNIWNEWADAKGDLGPVYGVQWRSWPCNNGDTIDQIAAAIHQLKHTPDSRRIIVSAWNVGQLHEMALMPCHAFFQFYVTPATDTSRAKLSCQLYQRSADMFLGVPFNIASYALLVHMIAQQVDMDVGEFIWTGGDCHIYTNHLDQIRRQLSRDPLALPQIKITKKQDINSYNLEDIELIGYDHYPAIKAPVAV